MSTPAYDRSSVVPPGVVLLGVGGFARSLLAEYLDRVLAAGHTGWGVCGLGTQPGDRVLSEVVGRDRDTGP